ncbi:MAG: hypothetical protein GKR89_08210 [Candidatus Latescibacteria bacterium]|nr:hypothetical protein [Candidatus Latescibacterota bacterium]
MPVHSSIDLQCYAEIEIPEPLGQFRAVPVNLGPGQPRAILGIYSGDAEIDPYIGMFFFPQSTTRFVLFTTEGEILWQRDLGPGIVSGIWFLPVFPFDLDGDGVDEIWFVGNSDPRHPLDYRRYVLERIDARTGQSTGQWPWPQRTYPQSMSHTYRNFIFGGYVGGEPVLVTAQGTYGATDIQGWRPDMSRRWEYHQPAAAPGCKGSHMCAVCDIDGDGVDEFLWGERCIEMDAGHQLYCADEESWQGHSDINIPVLDWANNRWYVFTCREQDMDTPPRLVLYDDEGRRVWGRVEGGHMDTGWAARLGEDGVPVVLGVRIGEKLRSAVGEFRTDTEDFTFHAFSGDPVSLPFNAYTTIPVDLNGDGFHELVRGYFEGNGDVLDRDGHLLGNVGGLSAMASKFVDLPGEQILSYAPDGKVRIWIDTRARDSELARRRYAHPHYQINQRLTACGYNLFNLGGI